MGAYSSGGSPQNFGLAVSQGGLSGTSGFSIYGRNPDVDTATVPEDVWFNGGVWVQPTVARVHNIASTSNSDSAAGGTGARTISIVGLNSTYDQISETISLNGTSNVPTVNSYIFISSMTVLTAGSGGANVGNISATAVTDATVSAIMGATYNKTTLGIYQVPNGYTGYISRWQAGMQQATASSGAEVNLLIKPFGGVFELRAIHVLSNSGDSEEEDIYDTYIPLAAKTIVKSQVKSVTANNTDIQARIQIMLVAN